MDLLTKTRRINRLLQHSGGQPVSFAEIASVLREVIHATVYVVSRTGKILGHALFAEDVASKDGIETMESPKLSTEMNADLARYIETTSNIEGLGPLFDGETETVSNNVPFVTTVVPMIGAGDRLGTLILCRQAEKFTDEDLLLGEYAAAVVGMEILRSRSEERDELARAHSVVQMAIDSLSYSELDAVRHVFEEIEGKQGLLVASKIADRAGITRSVIVNALRKLESAGVIESRSLGMKGTHIRILNDQLISTLERLKQN